MIDCRGDHDGIERGGFFPTEVSVTVAGFDVGKPQGFKQPGRLVMKFFFDFDGVYFFDDFGQHRRLVARACTDFKYPMITGEF